MTPRQRSGARLTNRRAQATTTLEIRCYCPLWPGSAIRNLMGKGRQPTQRPRRSRSHSRARPRNPRPRHPDHAPVPKTVSAVERLLLALDIQEEILFLPRTTEGGDGVTERGLRTAIRGAAFANQGRLWRGVKSVQRTGTPSSAARELEPTDNSQSSLRVE